MGRWAVALDPQARRYTRIQARRHIERAFNTAVLKILEPVGIADLRAVVLIGEEMQAPAIALVCDSVGQLDLGWIEDSEAPIPWRATAYAALEMSLGSALPVFGFQDLFQEISMYYWEGETEDEAARESLVHCHGADPGELDEHTLPSTMMARRPDWMIATNAAPPAALPPGLRKALKRLRQLHKAFGQAEPERNAWHFDSEAVYGYLPGFEECSPLPPLTLVPTEFFAPELDDVGRHGMEYGFMDVIGICPLPDADRIADWLISLQLGAQFLLAAQQLLELDPTTL